MIVQVHFEFDFISSATRTTNSLIPSPFINILLRRLQFDHGEMLCLFSWQMPGQVLEPPPMCRSQQLHLHLSGIRWCVFLEGGPFHLGWHCSCCWWFEVFYWWMIYSEFLNSVHVSRCAKVRCIIVRIFLSMPWCAQWLVFLSIEALCKIQWEFPSFFMVGFKW